MAQRKTFKQENEFYCIEARYEKGGMNYFNGREDKRGIYIHFDKKEIADGWTRTSPFSESSFKIFFQPLGRKSAKKVDAANEWIENNKDDLFDMYEELDKMSLLKFVQSVHIDTAIAA